jgi:hypothetical protein
LVVVAFTAPALAADPPAPPPAPVAPLMGAVVSLTGSSLAIKSADGKQTTVTLGDKVGVTKSRAGTVADIKSGQFIGVTAVEGPDGKLRASEVHIFPDSMRGTGEGHYPWGTQAKTTMTNGNVESLSGVSTGQTIKVTYKGGTSDVLIPPSVTVTVIEAAPLSDVKVGSMVTVFSTTNADGSKTAMGIGLAPAKS